MWTHGVEKFAIVSNSIDKFLLIKASIVDPCTRRARGLFYELKKLVLLGVQWVYPEPHMFADCLSKHFYILWQ